MPKLNSRLYGGCHVTVVAVTYGSLANEKAGMHVKSRARVRSESSKIRRIEENRSGCAGSRRRMCVSKSCVGPQAYIWPVERRDAQRKAGPDARLRRRVGRD